MSEKLPKSVWPALRGQLFQSMPIPTDDYTGKTIIVTGSNTGTGTLPLPALSQAAKQL